VPVFAGKKRIKSSDLPEGLKIRPKNGLINRQFEYLIGSFLEVPKDVPAAVPAVARAFEKP
jgi:hypothetical protein